RMALSTLTPGVLTDMILASGATPTKPVPVPRLAMRDAICVPWPGLSPSSRPPSPVPVETSVPGTNAPPEIGKPGIHARVEDGHGHAGAPAHGPDLLLDLPCGEPPLF